MYASGLRHQPVARRGASASVVAALFVSECVFDAAGVSIPRAEPHIAVRFGPSARRGLDLHVMGARCEVHRKTIRRGQGIVIARLRLGTHAAVLGVPPSETVGRIVPLEELWGDVATEELAMRLREVRGLGEAAAILETAIARRLPEARVHDAHVRLALDAVARLGTARVKDVAEHLGVSERHLRRVFRATVGMGPKEFAKLTRFHRALSAARDGRARWAEIAVASGYYDQAHLIAEFREIAGVTPRALLGEIEGRGSAP